MNRKHKDIPAFHDETEERAFWETHESTGYLDWTQARQAVFPDLKPTRRTTSLRLPQHLPDAGKGAISRVKCNKRPDVVIEHFRHDFVRGLGIQRQARAPVHQSGNVVQAGLADG